MITFAIAADGTLDATAIAKSSSEPELDQAALAAIRKSAPFPPPPTGATAAQRRFMIPFRFR